MRHQKEIDTPQSEDPGSSCQIRDPAAEDPPLTPRERIWQIVAAIPPGSVATYGQVAQLAGLPRRARLVGRTLSQLPAGSRLPWHRVVNAGLRISRRGDDRSEDEQRRRLEREGVGFSGPRILRHYLWDSA
jgi:methylated-DNA-protein-cysteine methyltransferase-like protein